MSGGIIMGLSQLVKISNKYGSNPEFVLAGGGNTSFKDEKFLYIKGSGTTLATITEEGFVKMNRQKLSEMLEKKYNGSPEEREAAVLEDMMDAREKTERAKRPSVETLLHNLINYKYIVHTHPAMINGLTCGKNGKKIADKLFGDDYIWIGIIEPGYTLASKLNKEMKTFREKKGCDAKVILLQNHGIFIGGDTAADIDRVTKDVFEKIGGCVKEKPDLSPVEFDRERAALLAPAVRMLLSDGEGCIVKFFNNKTLAEFIKDEKSFYPVSSAYSPDHIVYCRPFALFVKCAEDIDEQYGLIEKGIREYKEKNGFAPRIVCIQNLGCFAYGKTKKNADICAEVFCDAAKIGVYSKSFGGPLFMTDYMIDFICNWEVESYRSKVSLGSGNAKRLTDKISIVTGSAQGFGLGIAEEMLDQGSYVTIADLNYDLAKAKSDELNERFGKNKTIAVKVDVSSEENVRDMVYDTVLTYGGLDIFVSNAGIAIAGDLEQMTLQKFELVTRINYNAFFLCSKYASRIMKIQRRFAPDYMADIIQVNSKSGLEGSNKNFAYAGGKFGGIGLVQSFALELCPYGIKVNAVCPGNYLDGPLWSDPVKGLFVQYFNAGKVPGAKSIEDVRKYYMSKVPMNRGCLPKDVACAIFYIVDQKYETGQAVPVTGGQVMLK